MLMWQVLSRDFDISYHVLPVAFVIASMRVPPLCKKQGLLRVR